MIPKNQYDVIIVGGSYAGLSAAMALGRLAQSVLILDSGLPCNRQTPHSHNFITQDGQTPAAIAQKAKEQVLVYPTVAFHEALAVSGRAIPTGFEITTDTQRTFTSKKLIFATGIADHMPNIPGIAACWGISVIHCPFCHGYEVRGKKTAILANAEKAIHIAGLVSNLSQDIVLLTNGKADFTSEQQQKLAQNKIEVIESPISAIRQEQGNMQDVVFQDGEVITIQTMYAAVTFEQHCSIPMELGCALTETGYIQVDASQKTTVPGIYACGDNSTMFRSVSAAVATGSMAGAMVVKELTTERF